MKDFDEDYERFLLAEADKYEQRSYSPDVSAQDHARGAWVDGYKGGWKDATAGHKMVLHARMMGFYNDERQHPMTKAGIELCLRLLKDEATV